MDILVFGIAAAASYWYETEVFLLDVYKRQCQFQDGGGEICNGYQLLHAFMAQHASASDRCADVVCFPETWEAFCPQSVGSQIIPMVSQIYDIRILKNSFFLHCLEQKAEHGILKADKCKIPAHTFLFFLQGQIKPPARPSICLLYTSDPGGILEILCHLPQFFLGSIMIPDSPRVICIQNLFYIFRPALLLIGHHVHE